MATESAGDEPGRAWMRALLVICGVLAVILAALLVASVSTGGLAGSPIEQALPGEAFPDDQMGDTGAEAVTGEGGGFGALNPGDETGVGGETGFDNETYGSEDTAVHFTVESSQPSYWRTGSYDQYTGSGWESTLDPSPYTGELSHDGLAGKEVSYEVTLEQPAAALPTVWRPTTVEGVDDLHITDDGAVGVGNPVEAGTTFNGVSQIPEDDTDLLRSSDQSYPSELESQYTQLPADTPERVAEFTDELTADAENPYEKATIVEQWLRTEKGYSLEASTRSDSIADTFIFEMDEGYCEYFATAMTAMLRTQDIPTRYTVGYSTGTLVDENTYEVRGMNAHAWVEVYFEDIGWVPFEPTPASDRIDSEQTAIDDDELAEETEFGEESTRPGETAGPDGVEQPESVEDVREQFEDGNYSIPDDLPEDGSLPDDFPNQDGLADDSPDADIDPPENGGQPPSDEPGNGESDGTTDHSYAVTFNQSTLIPGESVEVTVTNNSEPAVLKEIQFNDEPIGITDNTGTVEGTVPYADSLEIGIEKVEYVELDEPPETSPTIFENDEDDTDDGGFPFGAPTGASGTTLFSGTGDGLNSLVGNQDGGTYPIETNATVTVSGDIHPGNTVTVTAFINETPISDAAVRVGDDIVTETDSNGQAEIEVPEMAGEKTVSVERSPITGNTTLDIPELDITVDENQLVALPFGSVTVEASYDNESVAGVPIERDGTAVATTGPDGKAVVGLPFASSAEFAVSQYDVRATSTVDGLFRNLAAVIFGTGILVGGPLFLFYRRGYQLRTVASFIFHLPQRSIALMIAVLVRISTNGEAYIRAAVTRLRSGLHQLRLVIQGSVHPMELLALLRGWLATQGTTAKGLFRRQTGTGAITEEISPDSRTQVREAWKQFLTHVSARGKSTSTPGELATHAIQRDKLPTESVNTLCETFRAVEYGHQPASERLDRVEQALQRIEQQYNEQRESGGTE